MDKLCIGLDIDGVIADAVSVMLPLLSEASQRPVTPRDICCRDFSASLGIDEAAARRVWEQTVNDGLLHRAAPIEGALEGLAALGRHEVWLVTARPAFMRELTESWLAENGVSYDNIRFDMSGSKAEAGPAFDLFVEDFLEEARPLAEAGIYTLVYDQPWNQAPALPDNCARVYGWDDVLEIVDELGATKGGAAVEQY
jgi:uncharacterized HAD superfamily protein